MSTVCLNMIVKDESHVIHRCLESVRHLIDYWVIVDTGSTDGTQAKIRQLMEGIPGELHERPWKNFGHNRSEALALARGKADYTFVIDADEILETPPGFRWPELVEDSYSLLHGHHSVRYWRPSLVASRLEWYYRGVLHEYLACATPHRTEPLPGPLVMGYYDGGRSQNIDNHEKYARDARTLEAALLEEPDNSRYVFYLAQSYRDSDQPEKALATYQRRAEMGGWEEEVWYSLYEVARLSEALNLDTASIVDRYLQAYQYRPRRAEPLGQLARLYREKGQYALAHLFAQQGLAIAKPDDLLFRDDAFYDWRCLDEYAIACYWLGEYAESERACRRLLAEGCLPDTQTGRVEANLDWALRQMAMDRPDEIRAAGEGGHP